MHGYIMDDEDSLENISDDESPSTPSVRSKDEQSIASQLESDHESQNSTTLKNYGSSVQPSERPPVDTYKVPCINRCGKVIDANKLEEHIANDCPLTLVDCSFKHIGCDVKLARRDLPVHLTHAVVYHLSKQTAMFEKRLKQLEDDNERLAVKFARLKTKHKDLEHHVSCLSYNVNDHPKQIFHQTQDFYENNLTIQCKPHSESLYDTPHPYWHGLETESVTASIPAALVVNDQFSASANFTMTNFEEHKRNDDSWISQPFYTHTQGYKMCLRVTANGQGSGKGTHITVAVYLMKGEFDDKLEWPFRGDITIQLLNQQTGKSEHYARTIYQAEGDGRKARSGERFVSAWSISRYKAHSELYPVYLQLDSLRFCVCTIVKNAVSDLETAV